MRLYICQLPTSDNWPKKKPTIPKQKGPDCETTHSHQSSLPLLPPYHLNSSNEFTDTTYAHQSQQVFQLDPMWYSYVIRAGVVGLGVVCLRVFLLFEELKSKDEMTWF